MKTRAQRRHEAARALCRARSVARRWAGAGETTASIERTARRIRDNRTPCSCQMCRNPRHSVHYKASGKLTVQELRATSA